MYRNAGPHGMWFVRADGHLYCSSYRWEVEDGFVGTKAISVRQLIDVAGGGFCRHRSRPDEEVGVSASS